ncbi:MAG: class I SAM-dependent methyltransferase [Candidatus Portnoybacteria bacterium]|nr:class I SAM-dependent methyltransferase [Candidatus Portnoybacteria bacterium]
MGAILEPFLHNLRTKKIRKYILPKTRVCDIGCGKNAEFLGSIKSFISEGVGYDREAENAQEGNIIFKKAQIIKEIPEPSDSFDCVTMLAVLEHLDYPQEILRESFRILKGGGQLLLTTPAKVAKPILEFLSFKLGIVSPEQIKDHKNYFNELQLRQALVDAGFKESNTTIKKFEFGVNLFARAIKV